MAFSLHGASWMLHGFLQTSLSLVYIPILFSLLYWGFTVALLRKRRERRPWSEAGEGTLPPVTFLRPIKRGLLGLEGKIRLLLAAARPGDWVLFAVSTEAERRVCQQVIKDAGKTLAGVRAEVFLCDPAEWEEGPSCNPKVCKLEILAAFLRDQGGPRHWILSDSEMLADVASLERFRREWAAAEAELPGGVALTAGYRFAGGRSVWQHLDHLPALLHLWPGLAVTEWVARWRTGQRAKKRLVIGAEELAGAEGDAGAIGLGFGLGACIAVRQQDIERVGGWGRFRYTLADDNRLGAALAAENIPTLLSDEVFTLDADSLLSREWVRHQHRVSFTYRVSNAPGFFGMVFTFGLSWAGLGVLLNPAGWSAWGLFSLMAAARYASAILAARALEFPVGEPDAGFVRRFGLVMATSLLEIFFWMGAWLPLPVWWGGRPHRVASDGKFSSENPQFLESSLASDAAFNYQSDT